LNRREWEFFTEVNRDGGLQEAKNQFAKGLPNKGMKITGVFSLNFNKNGYLLPM